MLGLSGNECNLQEGMIKSLTRSNGTMSSKKEIDGSRITQAELTEFVNCLEVKKNHRTIKYDYWEDYDTTKISNATFPGRHLLTLLF